MLSASPCLTPSIGTSVDDRGALYAGNRAQPFRERVNELGGAFGVRVGRLRQVG